MIGVPSVSSISKSGMRSPMLFPILKSIADDTGATVGEGAAGSSEPQAEVSIAPKTIQMAVNLIGNHTVPSSSFMQVFRTGLRECLAPEGYPTIDTSDQSRYSEKGRTGRVGIALALMLLASLAVLGCSSSSGGSDITPAPAEPPVSASRTGQVIFTTTCVACHGASGEGQPDWHIPKADGTLPAPPLNGDGHTWHHSDGFLYRYVKNGGKMLESPSLPDFKSAMPAFGEQLSHEEIVGVLTYVKSLWGEKTSRGSPIAEWQTLASAEDPFPTAP